MQNIKAFKMDLDVSKSEFNTIVHAIAINENRAEFARRFIYTSQDTEDSVKLKANGIYCGFFKSYFLTASTP